MAYKIVVTVDAKNDLEQFINYLIFDRKNTQAARNVSNIRSLMNVRMPKPISRKFLGNDDRVKRVVFNVFKDEDLKIYEEILGRQGGIVRPGLSYKS